MSGVNSVKLLQQVFAGAVKRGGYEAHMSKLCLLSAGDGRCLAKLKIEKEHTNRAGALHGGLTATLVDEVTSFALMTSEKASLDVSIKSVNINVSYLKAVKIGDEILLNARTLKMGKTLAFVDVDITNKETGDLVATGSHTIHVG